MAVTTVKVPLQKNLLQQIDWFVEKEAISRTDLILEAMQVYIDRKQNWQKIFSYGDGLASKNSFSETDVMREIKSFRATK
jgi:metal-responsive CopG/Arc/MetJ family transcriptional regulator